MKKCKVTKSQTEDSPKVSSPPLTESEFEKFLRTVTRPIEKLQVEKEKPQT